MAQRRSNMLGYSWSYHIVSITRALGADALDWWFSKISLGAVLEPRPALSGFSILLPCCLFLLASVSPSSLNLSLCPSHSGGVNENRRTVEFSKGLCLENTRSCIASAGSPPALLPFVCRVYLSQMQPFLHWGLCHAVHMLTLLPPTGMPHQGEAFSRAHINSCLLVA